MPVLVLLLHGMFGQGYGKCSSGVDVCVHGDRSAMAVDDAVDDRKSESRSFSVLLGCIERLKNMREVFFMNAASGIAERNLNRIEISDFPDCDSKSAAASHRFHGINLQRQQGLFQLMRIAEQNRRLAAESGFDLDVVNL